ncbi:MAG: hypothetical protein ACK4HB_04615 [Candidatus Bipolaricaulia bacterium]
MAVNGFNPWAQRHEHVRHIGVLFGQRSQLAWNLPVIESFRFLKEIYSIPESEYRARRDDRNTRIEAIAPSSSQGTLPGAADALRTRGGALAQPQRALAR